MLSVVLALLRRFSSRLRSELGLRLVVRAFMSRVLRYPLLRVRVWV